MKNINIRYFALLRDQANRDSERRETISVTAQELYEELREDYGLTLTPSLVKVAVNGAFEPMEYRLCKDDEVVFIPPVAGG